MEVHVYFKVRLVVPLTPQQLLAFRKEKNGRKGLSFTVRVYLNLQLSFFTQFREKLFCMKTTKAQISQRTCAVLQGGGGGGRIASRGRFVPVFLLGNKWQLKIFMGRSRPPAPSVSALIRVSNSLNSHFIYFIFAGPCQFTKRLLIISADAKGKDSMILFKIKETALINSGHVLF